MPNQDKNTKPNQNDKETNSLGKSSLSQERASESNAIQIPQISLPKGGGALKGIDEKFEVNAANGTAGFSIPLPITPGRNGFSPSLSLSYNSGGGNSPYGLGWSVGYPIIQRKTDKRLPRYRDGLEEDIFMFSGAEDLVPFLKDDGTGNFRPVERVDDGYTVKRYRPRIDGAFARIEKIHHANHGVYWKVTTRENIATIFGRSPNARIANPEVETQIFQWMPEFSYDDKGNWIKYEYKDENLINQLINVPNEVYEKNRINGIAHFTNVYLKRIKYGNRTAYYANSARPYDPEEPTNPEEKEYFFEVIFDYGEHRSKDEYDPNEIPTFTEKEEGWSYRPDAFSSYRSGFEIRTNRRCFGILMFHHFKDEKQFVGTPEEEDFGENYLVRSLDLEYEPSSINKSGQSETTYLKSITQSGYIRKPDGSYSKKSLPPSEFTYEKLHWNMEIKTVSTENLVNAPVGLTNNYQWVDFYGEGISGILTEQGEGWYYKSNLGDLDEDGNVAFTVAEKVIRKPSFLGLSNGVLSIQDLAASGEKQIVVNSDGIKGYFELIHDNDWKSFVPFDQIANVDMQDPNTRLIDLNGDGQPEIVITDDNVFVWYPADGKKGYSEAERTIKTFDEERGPAIVFDDQLQTIFLADMSGDGLTDIVRIRNGEVCYWANKGYGKFSAKVTMGNAPWFDYQDQFNPKYLHLADVSGTGATDIIYLGRNKFKAFINLSGNAWSDAHEIEPFFPIDGNSQLSVVDLLGTGTSCIVWSSDLPAHTNAPMRYIDLMDSKKPHVLNHYKNNLGKETYIEYKSSTHYYIKDKLEGKTWITKLPFAVQVVSKSVVEEKITDVRFSSEYRYHHGYYDHPEREFRGFGMVEQIDSEHYAEWSRNNATNQLEASDELYQKPVLTKTWFHTGTFLDRERILTHFKEEYWHEEYNRRFPATPLSITEHELPDAQLSDDIKALIGDEYREALRACKGMILRQEIFALDAPEYPTDAELQLQMKPYTVATHNCNVQLLQPRDKNEFGVFIVTESEAITISYERDETDYRLAHTLNTKIDDLGNILESASVVYGRQQAKADADFQSLSDNITDFSEDTLNNNAAQKTQLQNAFTNNIQAAKDEQIKTHIIYTQNSFAKYKGGATDFDDIDLPHAYRLRLPKETQTYELNKFSPGGELYQLDDFKKVFDDNSVKQIAYEVNLKTDPDPFPEDPVRRLIEHIITLYLRDDILTPFNSSNTNHVPLDFGYFDVLGLPYESYQLAYTPELVTDIYSKKDGTKLQADSADVSSFIKAKGNFTEFNNDGLLWIRSGFTHFRANADEAVSNVKDRFFSPLAFEDPYGAVTAVVYDTETFANLVRKNDGYYLFIKSSTDEVDNKVQIDVFNYRTMSPARMIDHNANPSSILLDELGLVKAVAVEGNGVFTDATRTAVNILQAADSLAGLKEFTEPAETGTISQFFGAATHNNTDTDQLRQAGNNLLQEASARFVYDFDTYRNTGNQPDVVASISREEHFADNNNSKIQFSFEYCDGLGNVAMTKVQAEPGYAFYIDGNGDKLSKNTGTDLRWVGNGRTILNNKGNPVKQYEPYFSTNFLYEDSPKLVEIGVTPILLYDSLGRLIKTRFPEGTLSKVEFDSWKQINFDQNDTLEEAECLWYLRRTDNTRPDFINDGKEQRSASEAQKNANTPSFLYLDSLGRPVLSVVDNGKDGNSKARLYTTFIQLDIEGNAKAVKDARDNTVMSYKYDMLGHRVYQNSMDAGERWVLNNLMGNTIHSWDCRDHVFSFEYDEVQRPKSIKVESGDSTTLNNIYEYIEFGEGKANQYQNNLRGQVVQQYDTAGRIQNIQFDFKGNILATSRELNSNYKDIPDWTAANRNTPSFDPDLTTYTSQIEYDALNRAIKTTTADNSEMVPVFNEAGLLEQVKVTQTGIAEKLFVKQMDYDAKGQREKIIYGDKNNNKLATTTYDYDEETFRLTHLKTTKANGDILQDLYYTYDPVGNITEIEDKALDTKFFNNNKIEPRGLYKYDALYRLIEATGREHAGQATNFGQCDNWKDKAFLTTHSPGDDMAFRNYTQKYSYDPVGNILIKEHKANAGSGNWTRTYEYEGTNNRLIKTKVGQNTQTYNYSYHYDTPLGSGTNNAHGFITSLSHLSKMEWNFKDELQATARQVVCKKYNPITETDDIDDNPPETTYYVYDANGQRVRKVTEVNGGGSKKEERLYLGSIEVYKKHAGKNTDLERTTLHVMDDTRRIAMLDTQNGIDTATDLRTIRFQFGNHLGSASLELDDSGELISYEEYHPYGTTAYQAVNKDVKAAAKRYRYTGMERDEETGMAYHCARYYLPWLGRWLSVDPIGIQGGMNLYSYTKGNPIKFFDQSGTQASTDDNTDPSNFSNFDSFRAANSEQPEEVVWQVWAEANQDNPSAISSQETTPDPSPPTHRIGSRVIESPPPVSPTDDTLYVSQGPWSRGYQDVMREVYDPNNSLGSRAVGLAIGTIATPFAMIEDLGRSILNVPFFMHNAGIGIGEHTGRAVLWADQGEYAEASLEGLHVVRDAAFGIGAGLSVAAPVAGAVASRATTVVARAEVQIASEETVSVYHGSWNNAPRIRATGLDASRVTGPNAGATNVTTDLRAATNAIEGRYEYQFLTTAERAQAGVIESRIPMSEFSQLPPSRPYPGFSGANLQSSEILLSTEEHILLFNRYIVR